MTDILLKYTVVADKVPGLVTVLKKPEEYVPVYNVVFPRVAPATEAVLDSIKEKMIETVKIDISEILDPKALEDVKKRFLESADQFIKRQMPKIAEREKAALSGYLVHE